MVFFQNVNYIDAARRRQRLFCRIVILYYVYVRRVEDHLLSYSSVTRNTFENLPIIRDLGSESNTKVDKTITQTNENKNVYNFADSGVYVFFSLFFRRCQQVLRIPTTNFGRDSMNDLNNTRIRQCQRYIMEIVLGGLYSGWSNLRNWLSSLQSNNNVIIYIQSKRYWLKLKPYKSRQYFVRGGRTCCSWYEYIVWSDKMIEISALLWAWQCIVNSNETWCR